MISKFQMQKSNHKIIIKSLQLKIDKRKLCYQQKKTRMRKEAKIPTNSIILSK
jgi:hypothetical protein